MLGNVLALDEGHQQHLLRHEELRQLRDAAPRMPKIFGLACNTQFSCVTDESGRDMEVMVLNRNRSKISFGARISSCALKPDDGHLLVACEDATLSTYRLDPSSGNASTVLKLHFSEDPPKEVAWHPINQKVFFTLHATRIRLWNLQLLHFATMGQAKNGVLVTPELLEASSGEARVTDPKETLQHMSVSPSGRYLIAVSEKFFWRWSVREEAPEDLEIFDLEELDASQELRYVQETSPDRVLMVGEREVTDVLLFCGDGGTRIMKLVVTQHLKFQSPIRCQPKTPDAFLALCTASEPEGQVDLLLRAEKGHSLTSLVARRLEDVSTGHSASSTVSQRNSEVATGAPRALEAQEYPPGLPMPRYSRPPGLPSPPNRMIQAPPGLNPMVSFDVPPGLALDAPQADLAEVGTSQPSQPSQSSARSEKDEAAAPRTVESSDDLSGDAKPAAPATESTATTEESRTGTSARELSHFMQKRADRASDQVVDQVLQRLPDTSGKPERKIMQECKQIEEQAQRTQRQVLKVLERPRPPSHSDPAALKTRCSEAVHAAATAARFPQHLGQHLAEEPRAEVIRQHLRPSKEKITQVLQGQKWHQEVKSSLGKLPTRQALEGFMAEVSSQSMQEMKRLLAEVQTEGLQTSITDACRESVRATLRQEVQALEAEVKSQSKQVTCGSGTKDALMRRLGQKALPLHTELDQIDKELHAAGELLAKRTRGQERTTIED